MPNFIILTLKELIDFNNEAGDGIIDDAGGDALFAFGLEGTLVAVELIAMETCIMLVAFGIKNETITTGARLIVDHDVSIGSFPDEVDISADDVSIGIEMTEGLLVMTFDGCAISLFEGICQELPRVEQEAWLGHIPGGKTIAVAKLGNLINTDVVIAAAEYLMDEVAHKGIITIASNFHSAFIGVNNLDIMRGVPCLRRGDEEAVVKR